MNAIAAKPAPPPGWRILDLGNGRMFVESPIGKRVELGPIPVPSADASALLRELAIALVVALDPIHTEDSP